MALDIMILFIFRFMHIPITTALEKIKASSQLFEIVHTRGSLQVEIYKPQLQDHQKPHTQDEVYIIISGTGKFVLADQTYSFQPLDYFFVPAGKEHRFEDFTDDFCTWVVFYGPAGGENPDE
jgi:mannose-6-phosphate isomerase-like protein (cupin superfamily)